MPTPVLEKDRTKSRAGTSVRHVDLEKLKRALEGVNSDQAHERLLRAMANVEVKDLDALMTGKKAIPGKASAREAMRVTAWLTATTQRRAAELLGVSDSRISRNDTINRAMLDRLQALASIFARVSRVIGLEGAPRWFQDPNPGLDGETPIAMFETAYGRNKVDALITALLYGDIV